ncbi:hypothetical protein BDF14DRAFT_1748353 [Spinellus fusiger]|nr:hypothetical protein BDF14DRAFT_1748353 [Spinellus fusiger]
MAFLTSIPFIGSMLASKTDHIRKSIVPISTVLKRQSPFSPSSRPLTQKSAHDSPQEVVTEISVLNDFPRPNLMPTLHFSLFGLQNSPPQATFYAKKCTNCAGPHSTEFCPC